MMRIYAFAKQFLALTLTPTIGLAIVLTVGSAADAQTKRRAPKALAAAATLPTNAEPQVQDDSSGNDIRNGLEFEAFIDVQARVADDKAIADRGVTLNDAALYLAKDFGGIDAVIDLPFATDLGGSNDLTFAQDQAQAHFGVTRGTLTGKLGQYDTFYGIESNDSKDRFFADAGAIKAHLLPFTHTGVVVSYNAAPFLFRGQIANPNGRGTLGDNNPAFGGQILYEIPTRAFGAVGLLINEAKGDGENKTNLLINVVGGFRSDQFRVEGEFDIKETQGFDTTAQGFGVFAAYQHASDLGFGGRFEYLKDPVVGGIGGTLADTVYQLSVGPSYQYTPDLTLRGDLSIGDIDYPSDSGIEDLTSYGVMVSVVAEL